MLSTKARRVSVGARAGNARRSALRRGCGERFRTWAGKVWPIARGRGPGEPGTHARGAGARPEGSRDADARKFGPEGRFADARSAEALTPGACPCGGPVARCRRHLPQDSAGRCGSGSTDALGLPCSGEPGRLKTPMPEISLRPGPGTHARGASHSARRTGTHPRETSTPQRSGAESDPRGGADARKFASGNGLRRSERSGCGCRKLRSHRPESRPAKNSALLRLPAPQTAGNIARTSSVQSHPRATGAVSRR